MKNKLFRLDLIIFLVGVFYVSWQICGLRYVTHDDIYYNLHAKIFSGDYITFTIWVAHAEARIQHYIKQPLLLAMDGLTDSPLYDVLNIASLWVLYAAYVWILNQIGTLRNALLFSSITLFLFPLHYYFTSPQGFPVMGYYGLIAVFISAGLMSAYLRDGALWRLILSTILFAISLSGSEYNLILHPILLGIVAFCATTSRPKIIRVAIPYLVGWLICVFLYVNYAAQHAAASGGTPGRTMPALNIRAFGEALFILEKKAFLPLGLIDGIWLNAATAQGAPEVPGLLTYSSLAGGQYDFVSIAVVFIVFWLICSVCLGLQHLSRKALVSFSLISASFAIIPAAVLASSKLYQMIIPIGYIQGHITSFYSQLGMSGLFFLICATLCNISPRGIRNITALALGGVLACAATWTFIYNNLNRQVMAANQQKWGAFQELVSYVSIERADLKTHPFYAPSLWTLSGVSAIPDPSPFMSGNYWTTYSKVMMGAPLTILDGKTGAPADAVFASYFATPRNIPVITLYVRPTESEAGTLTLVTPSPLAGSISYRFVDGMAISHDLANWTCREYCVVQWQEMRPVQPDSISVTPSDSGPKRLLLQFFLPRGGAFGKPLAGVR